MRAHFICAVSQPAPTAHMQSGMCMCACLTYIGVCVCVYMYVLPVLLHTPPVPTSHVQRGTGQWHNSGHHQGNGTNGGPAGSSAVPPEAEGEKENTHT